MWDIAWDAFIQPLRAEYGAIAISAAGTALSAWVIARWKLDKSGALATGAYQVEAAGAAILKSALAELVRDDGSGRAQRISDKALALMPNSAEKKEQAAMIYTETRAAKLPKPLEWGLRAINTLRKNDNIRKGALSAVQDAWDALH